MDFSKMRHRIVFLKPMDSTSNSFDENVMLWTPFKPAAAPFCKTDAAIRADSGGRAVFTDPKHTAILRDFEVWAFVSPMTGREYEEAQKLRGETTYNIITRFFEGITHDMKIVFKGKIFDIVSVLNIAERDEQLKIVAKERGSGGEG